MKCQACSLWFPSSESTCHRCGQQLDKEPDVQAKPKTLFFMPKLSNSIGRRVGKKQSVTRGSCMQMCPKCGALKEISMPCSQCE